MNKRYFFYAFIAIVAGIFVSVLTAFSKITILVIALITLALFKKRFLFILSIVVLTSVTVTTFSHREYRAEYKNITVTGRVTEVRESNDSLSLVIKNCNYGEIENTNVYAHIYEYKYNTEIKEGNLISLTGDAYPIKYDHANPGDVPFSQLYKNMGYSFYVEDFTVLDNKTDVNYLFNSLKDKIRTTIFSSIDSSDAGAVLYAMVTGDKDFISMETVDVFASCGTSHLLAVSGLHIGILLNLFTYFLEKIRVKNLLAVILLGILATVYSAFTGFSSSVLRASLMAMVHALSRLLGGKYDSVNSLCFAGSVILLFEPFRLFDAAFQLSFCACFGIAWIVRYTVRTKIKFLNAILNAGAITFGATIFTLPLQLYYFGTFSVVSIFANMLLVSVASFALMLTFLFIIPAMLWSKLAFLMTLPGFIMGLVVEVSHLLARVPHFTFKPVSLFLALSVLALMVFLTRFIHTENRIKIKAVGAVLLVSTLAFVGVKTFDSNHISINVPYFYGENMCVHLDGDKYYVFGLCNEDSIDRQIKYIYRNTDTVEAVFIMNEKQMTALPIAMEKGLTFNKLYVSPKVKMNKAARMNKARYITEAVYIENGVLTYDEGLIFTYGGKEYLLFDGNATFKKYHLAVTEKPSTRAETIITKGIDTDNARKIYDIDKVGHTRIYIRSIR